MCIKYAEFILDTPFGPPPILQSCLRSYASDYTQPHKHHIGTYVPHTVHTPLTLPHHTHIHHMHPPHTYCVYKHVQVLVSYNKMLHVYTYTHGLYHTHTYTPTTHTHTVLQWCSQMAKQLPTKTLFSSCKACSPPSSSFRTLRRVSSMEMEASVSCSTCSFWSLCTCVKIVLFFFEIHVHALPYSV